VFVPKLFRAYAIEEKSDADYDGLAGLKGRLVYIVAKDVEKAKQLFQQYYPDFELTRIMEEELRELIIQDGVYCMQKLQDVRAEIHEY
jgi:hypothetical protein